jgi:hypothetical protein
VRQHRQLNGLSARRQSGQAVIVVALAMTAMVAMLALVLMGGAAYWERRHLQELADSAALAASITAGGDCSLVQAQAVAANASDVLIAQLGPTGPAVVSGGCTAGGYVMTYTFSDGTAVAINWPYAGGENDRVGAVVRHQIGLQLPGFVGSNANIAASAVAQADTRSRPGGYAIYAYDGITCGGAAVNVIKGSVYTGGTIDTNCGWYIQEIKAGTPSTTIDFGDILVHQTQPAWQRGGGHCLPGGPIGNAICADGYEISGTPSTCATPYPVGTSYLDSSQLTPVAGVVPNPMPCPGDQVPAPAWNLTPDPNKGPSAINQDGAPCPVGGSLINASSYPQLTLPGAAGPVARASNGTATPAKAAPGTPTLGSDGLWHFHPGCYAWIDVADVPGGVAVLDPGFYHFNGFFVPSGPNHDPAGIAAGGVAINGSNSRLLGRGVTLEFANPAGGASSFSGTEIDPASGTPSACGNAQSCFLGADPQNPVKGYTYFSAPCSSSDLLLAAGCATASPGWCLQVGTSPVTGAPVYDPSCYDVLVWAPSPATPPGIGGSFWFKGQGSFEWAYGEIEWPNTCAWSANGSSILIGQLLCDTLSLQGGSIATGPAVEFGRTGKNHFNNEPGLKA